MRMIAAAVPAPGTSSRSVTPTRLFRREYAIYRDRLYAI
jgi:hypothetical protein